MGLDTGVRLELLLHVSGVAFGFGAEDLQQPRFQAWMGLDHTYRMFANAGFSRSCA